MVDCWCTVNILFPRKVQPLQEGPAGPLEEVQLPQPGEASACPPLPALRQASVCPLLGQGEGVLEEA